MKKKMKKVLPDIAFLAAVFSFLLCWAMIQPYNASPDEAMKYPIVEYIIKYGALPHGGAAEIRNELWGTSYAFNPITPYIIGAGFGKLASWFTQSPEAPLLAARLVNVLLGTATAGITLKTGRLLFKRGGAGLFTVLVCFLPGALFLHSYLNTDAMGLFSAAWIILCWVKAVKKGWSPKLCIELGIALSVCLLSYYNAYGYLVCSVLFFGGSILLCEKERWKVKKLFSLGVLVVFVVVVLAGWWFVRNGILYQGDILGMHTSSVYAQEYASEALKPSNRQVPAGMGMTIMDMFFLQPGGWPHNWLTTVAVSFVGTFGFLDIFIPYTWTKVYFLLFGIGMLGMFLRVREQFFVVGNHKEVECLKNEQGTTKYITIRKEKHWDRKNYFHLCMLTAMVIPFLLLVYYSYTSDFQAQGRYIMPMLIPFMYFVTKGIENILNKLVKKEAIKRWVFAGLGIAYTVSAAAIYLLEFAPNYR